MFLEWISYLIQSVSSATILTLLAKSRWHKAYLFLGSFGLSLINTAIVVVLPKSVLGLPLAWVKLPLAVLISWLALSIFAAHANREKLKILLTQLGLTLLGESAALVFLGLVTVEPLTYQVIMEPSALRFAGSSIYAIVYLKIGVMVAILWHRFSPQLRNRFILATGLLLVMHLTVLIAFYSLNIDRFTRSIGWVGMLLALLMLLTDAFLYQSLSAVMRLYQSRRELELINRQMTDQYEYFHLAAQHAEQIKTFKHDLANQLQTAYFLVKNQSAHNPEPSENALGLIERLSDRLHEMNTLICRNNLVINAVLTQKHERAREQQTDLRFEITPVEFQSFNDIDLCSIATNLLDNALEACLMQSTLDRQIKFSIQPLEAKEGIQITVDNTCPTEPIWDESGLICTTKPEDPSNEHGLGLKSVRSIVRRYRGALSLSWNNGHFTATVTLRY